MVSYWMVDGIKYKYAYGVWYKEVTFIFTGTSVQGTRWESCESPY